MTLHPKRLRMVREVRRFRWELLIGSEKVTSRFLSVQIQGDREQAGLLEIEWPAVRLEVRAGGEICAVPVSATYGFNETTGELALRGKDDNPNEVEPNTTALMLTEKGPASGRVSIHLFDVASGFELKKKDVEVSLVF